MSRTLGYLISFTLDSFLLLFIGKSSLRDSDSISKFFIGERKNGTRALFFTFVGTWISAATILGYTGNVYQNGTRVLAVSVIPWFIGALLLYSIVGRLREYEIYTIPELFGKRFDSRLLQVMSGLLTAGGYILYLVIQIKGFGIAASSLLNIDYKVAVFLVYLFILYSTFGGFNSVTKSDACNLVMLTISVAIVYFTVLSRVEGAWFLTDSLVKERTAARGFAAEGGGIFEGYSGFMYATTFFGWGMGLAANPQYLIRIVAAKDHRSARQMIVWALLFLAAVYFALTEIGLGLRILYPELIDRCATDDIFVYAVNNMMFSRFSGFFLLSVIGACISTANSQLLLIGSSLSYDVTNELAGRRLSEERLLNLTRLFIFIGGTAALLLSLNPPGDILSFGSDIWGLFSAMFTPLIYGGLYWKRGSRQGALAAFFTGAVCSGLFYRMALPVYWAFPATACSTAVYLLVSLWGERKAGRDTKKEGKEGDGGEASGEKI